MDGTFQINEQTIKSLLSIEAKLNALTNAVISILAKVENKDPVKLMELFNTTADSELEKLMKFYQDQSKL